MAHYGTDLKNTFEVVNPEIQKDENGLSFLELEFKTVSGIENLEQAIYNRLITHFGEFELFQYYKFFNPVYDYWMSTNIPLAIQGMKYGTIECLRTEPFVQEVNNVDVTSLEENRAFQININFTAVGGEKFNVSFMLYEDMTLDIASQMEEEIYEE
jgi:hypothetical protein